MCRHCGAVLRLDATSCPLCQKPAGEEATTTSLRRCPSCGFHSPASSLRCGRCAVWLPAELVGRTGAPPVSARSEGEIKYAVAWELWIVIPILALSVIANVLAMQVLPAAIGGLMVTGLFLRRAWAWWVVVVLGGIGAVLFVVALQISTHPDAAPYLLGAAAVNIIVIGLLISCRVRNAY